MRTLIIDENEQSLHNLASDFFATRASLVLQQESTRRSTTNSERPSVMRDLCTQMAGLDFFSQAASESSGGIGLSRLASGLVAEAAGAELVNGAWMDQLLAVWMLDASGNDVVAPFLTAEMLASVAFNNPLAQVQWDSDLGTVNGTLCGLNFGAEVDRFVVLAADAVLVIDPHADGVGNPETSPGMDPLSYSVSVTLDHVQPEHARFLLPGEHQTYMALSSCIAAAYSVGAASRCLDIAIAYVKEREQFGRAVGSFQAIKHRAANGAVDILHTRSLIRSVLSDPSLEHASEARVLADQCYRSIAESALQMHGGVGFTMEVPIHLFLKSAQRMRGWPRPVEESFEDVKYRLGLQEPARRNSK